MNEIEEHAKISHCVSSQKPAARQGVIVDNGKLHFGGKSSSSKKKVVGMWPLYMKVS